MVQIVLIRPGSTDYDDEGRIQGTLDIPLNEKGLQDAQRLVEDLRSLGIVAIYSCPCQAAEKTSETLATALGVKLKTIDSFKNIDHGLWQGLLIDEVKRKQPKVFRQWQEQPETICPPEGEMLSQAQERVQAALAKVVKKHKDATIALVVPEPLASVVHAYLSRCEIGESWKGTSFCGKWEVISLESEKLAPLSP